MIKVKRIDHVAIATADPGGIQARLLALFDLSASRPELVVDQKVEATFLHAGAAPGGTAIELICPTGNESLDRFVAKRGSALHHICFEVEDLAGALATLKSAGIPLVDEVPRRGARGHWVGFIHPKATGGVLFELCQPAEGETS